MIAFLALILAMSTCSAGPDESFMGRPIARTMTYHGAPWLTRATREREERPDLLDEALQVRRGAKVCDVGAGNGFHSLRLAKKVGKNGLVYAIDIQPEMLELLEARASEAGIQNIRPVLNTQTRLGLPDGSCDHALMVDVYHELAEPAVMLRALRQALSPQGELTLVEFREEDPSVPIKPRHKMSKAQVHRELTAHGFKLVRESNALPWQHVMVYQRSDSPTPAIQPSPWP